MARKDPKFQVSSGQDQEEEGNVHRLERSVKGVTVDVFTSEFDVRTLSHRYSVK